MKIFLYVFSLIIGFILLIPTVPFIIYMVVSKHPVLPKLEKLWSAEI